MFKIATLLIAGFSATTALKFLPQEFQAYSGGTFTTACTVDAQGADSCPAGFCCSSWTKGGVAQPAKVCIATDFHSTPFKFGTTAYLFQCTKAPLARTACSKPSDCTTPGTCCSELAVVLVDPATGAQEGAVASKGACVNSSTLGPIAAARYTADTLGGDYIAGTQAGQCLASSKASFMNVSVMVLAALLSIFSF